MTPKQHLARIINYWTAFGTAKYLAGQKEHGGRLWEKRGMLAHCEEEVWDLAAYLPTLRAQLEEVATMLQYARDGCKAANLTNVPLLEAQERLNDILGPPVNRHFGEE